MSYFDEVVEPEIYGYCRATKESVLEQGDECPLCGRSSKAHESEMT